jgi:hypothetical protein
MVVAGPAQRDRASAQGLTAGRVFRRNLKQSFPPAAGNPQPRAQQNPGHADRCRAGNHQGPALLLEHLAMHMKDASQLVIDNLGALSRTISHAPIMSDVRGQPGRTAEPPARAARVGSLWCRDAAGALVAGVLDRERDRAHPGRAPRSWQRPRVYGRSAGLFASGALDSRTVPARTRQLCHGIDRVTLPSLGSRGYFRPLCSVLMRRCVIVLIRREGQGIAARACGGCRCPRAGGTAGGGERRR